jgi:hypothetical protein
MIDLETNLRRVLAEDAVVARTFTVDDIRSGHVAALPRPRWVGVTAGIAAVALVAVGIWTVARRGDSRVITDASTSSSPSTAAPAVTTSLGAVAGEIRQRFFLPTRLPDGVYPSTASAGSPAVDLTLLRGIPVAGLRELHSASEQSETTLRVVAGTFVLDDPTMAPVTIHGVPGRADAQRARWTEKGFTFALQTSSRADFGTDARTRAESVIVGASLESIVLPPDGREMPTPSPDDWYFSASYGPGNPGMWFSVSSFDPTDARLLLPKGAVERQVNGHPATVLSLDGQTLVSWDMAPGAHASLSGSFNEQTALEVAAGVREVDETEVKQLFGNEYRRNETLLAAPVVSAPKTLIDRLLSDREVVSLYEMVGQHTIGYDSLTHDGGMIGGSPRPLVHFQDDRLLVAAYVSERDDRVEVVANDVVVGQVSGRATPSDTLIAYGTVKMSMEQWATQVVKVRLVNDRLGTSSWLFDLSGFPR